MLRPLTTEDLEGKVGRRAFAQDYSEPEGLVRSRACFSGETSCLKKGRRSKGIDQAWGGCSYGIILTVVASLENALQEDTKLLIWYHPANRQNGNYLGG